MHYSSKEEKKHCIIQIDASLIVNTLSLSLGGMASWNWTSWILYSFNNRNGTFSNEKDVISTIHHTPWLWMLWCGWGRERRTNPCTNPEIGFDKSTNLLVRFDPCIYILKAHRVRPRTWKKYNMWMENCTAWGKETHKHDDRTRAA